jgi:hypothetical protein
MPFKVIGLLAIAFGTFVVAPALAQSSSCHNRVCLALSKGALYHVNMDQVEQTGAGVSLRGFRGPGTVFCDNTQVCLIVDSGGRFWRANMRPPTDLQGPKPLK